MIDHGMRRLRDAWLELNATLGGGKARTTLDPALPPRELDYLTEWIQTCLTMPGTEYARRTEATRIGLAYAKLPREGRLRFLRLLGTGFDIDETQVETAIAAWRAAPDEAGRSACRETLRQALVPARVRLLMLFNALPEGIRFLVDMRAELLSSDFRGDPALAAVERDLRQLLAGWFDIGFLQLQRVDWNTPAAFLEKLIDGEAVHAFSGWDDLKHRLAADRRLYAFVHPNMPGEPLIFVQVALCEDIAGNVQALLDTTASPLPAEHARTAVFYSISNAQPGLSGISFGNYLIRRVVNSLRVELPNLNCFATLSPMPGFAAWLRDMGPEETHGLLALLESPRWHEDATSCSALRPVLLRAAAIYLLGHAPGSTRARDAVAHFHLGNGACVHRIDWMGDTSPRGLAGSCGLMVNYLYETRHIDRRSEAYARSGEIARAPAIDRLAR